MAILVTNNLDSILYIGSTINRSIGARASKIIEFVAYDDAINEPEIDRLLRRDYISIVNLDALGSTYAAGWNQEPKLKLGTYTFWIDALSQLRMKSGTPTSDTDGVVIGPGGAPLPHGNTHVFTGSDPIPNIEVVEAQYTCTVAEQVRDVVFEAASNFVRQANAGIAGNMPAVGVIISKPTPTTCILAQSGEIPGYSGLSPGAPYFVSNSVPGTITPVAPSGSGHFVQRIGYSKNGTTLRLEIYPPTKKA